MDTDEIITAVVVVPDTAVTPTVDPGTMSDLGIPRQVTGDLGHRPIVATKEIIRTGESPRDKSTEEVTDGELHPFLRNNPEAQRHAIF